MQDVSPKQDGMREKYSNIYPRTQSLTGASNWLNPLEGSQQGSLNVQPAAGSLPGQVGGRQTDRTAHQQGCGTLIWQAGSLQQGEGSQHLTRASLVFIAGDRELTGSEVWHQVTGGSGPGVSPHHSFTELVCGSLVLPPSPTRSANQQCAQVGGRLPDALCPILLQAPDRYSFYKGQKQKGDPPRAPTSPPGQTRT